MSALSFYAGGRRRKLSRRKVGGNFRIVFQHKGRVYAHSLGTTLEHVAKAKAREKIEAAINGDHETLRRTKMKSEYAPLQEIAEIYVKEYGTTRKRAKVARGNVGALAKMLRLGKGLSLANARSNVLTDELVRRYAAEEEKRIECDKDGYMCQASELTVRTTICSVITQGRAIFKPATLHWFDSCALPDLTKFRRQGVTKPDRPNPEPLNEGVIASINAAAPALAMSDPPMYAAFLLFSQCGLRNSEIEFARRSWLRELPDGSGEIAIVVRPSEGFKPKTKTDGVVPIARPVLKELLRISTMNKDVNPYLVPARSPTKRHAIVNGEICEWAGRWIKDRSKVIYELRRYAGSLYYDQVGDILLVQQFLRHADLATTMKWYWYRLKKLQPLKTPTWMEDCAPQFKVVA